MSDDKQTKLTPEQLEQAKAWVDRHHPGDMPCPICATDVWIPAEDLVAPVRTSPSGGYYLGGGLYPFFQLICSTCGYTHFFNAVIMGLVKPVDEEPSERGGGQ